MIDVQLTYARSLFRTEEFLRSRWVTYLADSVGQVFTTTDPMLPGHFGTYFGALQVREYGNPYHGDLYHLHELVHLLTWRDDRRRLKDAGRWHLNDFARRENFNQWLARICDSERRASGISEYEVYLRIPGLRQKVFTDMPIWVDRFLEKYDVAAMHPDVIDCLSKDIEKARIKVLHSESYDIIEEQIKRFHFQNVQWCRIWSTPLGGDGPFRDRPAYRLVEAHMSEMDALPNLDQHRAWLRGMTVQGTDSDGKPAALPFLNQALAFMPYYKQTREEYGNECLRT